MVNGCVMYMNSVYWESIYVLCDKWLMSYVLNS